MAWMAEGGGGGRGGGTGHGPSIMSRMLSPIAPPAPSLVLPTPRGSSWSMSNVRVSKSIRLAFVAMVTRSVVSRMLNFEC